MEVIMNIFIGESKNIRSTRGVNSFNVFVKVDFSGETLAESPRHELMDGTSHINMEFQVSHSFKMGNQNAVEGVMRNPLLVSIFEVLPKDKKAREEKTQLLGVGSLDLLPFLKGEQMIETSLTLHPLTAAHSSQESDQSSFIEVDLKVSTEKSLLSEDDRDHGNILFLRVKGLYSLPDALTSGGAHMFTMATPSPNYLVNQAEILTAQGGEMKSSGSADLALANKKWRWPTVNSSNVGQASLISSSSFTPNAVEDEKGHLRSQSDIEFRQTAECTKPCVAWNTELRAFLTSKANSSFLSSLSTCSMWPLEVVRVLNIVGKGKAKDEINLSYNGVCYADLSTLLYPGATKLCGAFPLNPLVDAEIARKCKVTEKSIMESIHKATTVPAKNPTGGKRPGTAARHSVVSLASQSSMIDESAHAEGLSFLDSKTYILLEFELARPLVPRRTAIAIAERIIEYIPPRPPLPKRVGGVEKAINDYHSATVDVAGLLLADYRSLYGGEVSEDALQNTSEASEDRRKKLIYHLNQTGHYHAYKEHIKKSVLELVRQKFINEATTSNEEELQGFLSTLYTYLVDEMHKGLGKTFSLEQSVSDPPNIVDCDMLRQYALESEQMLDMDMAGYYHKELLSREGHVSLHWYEYGVYQLLKSDYDTAAQCFKESISLDQKFVPALLLYGICCCVNDKHSEAEEVLEFATAIEEYNTIAWTIRGLCYELSGNTSLRDMCLEQAYKLSPGGKKKTYIVVAKGSTKKATEKRTAELNDTEQLQQHSQTISDKPPANTDQLDQPEGDQTDLNKDISLSVPESLNNPQELQAQTSTNNDQLSSESQKETELLSLSEKDNYEFSPFIQTVIYLLDVNVAKFAEMCLAHEHVFLSSKQGKSKTTKAGETSNGKNSRPQQQNKPTPSKGDTTDKESEPDASDMPPEFLSLQYDIAMGRLSLLNEDFTLAQFHLKRAIQMDILNSNAVALLGHSLYLSGEFDAAKDYYQRAVEYVNPPSHINTVLLRLADIYMKQDEYLSAKDTYLRACRHSPSSVSWKGVGIACYMLQEYDNSEDALSEANILNNLDPEIWAYLSLLCSKTNRPQEASQAASFALKTGLKNAELLPNTVQ